MPAFQDPKLTSALAQFIIRLILLFVPRVIITALTGVNFITSLQDLEDSFTKTGNAFIIPEGSTLVFCGKVDIGNHRFSCGKDVCIKGWSSETSYIIASLGDGQALIVAVGSLPMQDISLDLSHNGSGVTPVYLALDGITEAGAAIDWAYVNFIGSAPLGSIGNYGNVVFSICAFISNIGQLNLYGSFDSVVVDNSIFRNTLAGYTLINFDSTAVINRRIRIENSPILVPVGSVGINLPLTATVPNEGYIAKFVNFSGGGTYLQGVQPDDNKALFFECRGVANSANTAQYYMEANATATVITVAGTYEKVAGTTILSISERFLSPSSNRVDYNGVIRNAFLINGTVSFASGNGHQVAFRVYKNGIAITGPKALATANASGRAENVGINAIVYLEPSDYIELYATNETSATDVTVTDLNISITKT